MCNLESWAKAAGLAPEPADKMPTKNHTINCLENGKCYKVFCSKQSLNHLCNMPISFLACRTAPVAMVCCDSNFHALFSGSELRYALSWFPTERQTWAAPSLSQSQVTTTGWPSIQTVSCRALCPCAVDPSTLGWRK